MINEKQDMVGCNSHEGGWMYVWMDGFEYSIAIVDAFIASIAIRIMSDTKDEEQDRNKDQRSKVCCKTPKIQEITVRYIIPVIYLMV